MIQEIPGRNVFPAMKFGQIEVLLPTGDIVFSPAPMVRTLQRKLSRFTDEDYLLLCGDPIAMSVATAMAFRNNAGKATFLKWDKQEQEYIPVPVDLSTTIKEVTDGE